MAKLNQSLKNLGKAINGVEPEGKHVVDVINNIANDYGYLEVTDITALTTDQIEKLECGDVVIKVTGNQKHRYVVSYKEHHVGICLTYTDASVVETHSYDYTNKNWVYNSVDVAHIADNAQ